MFLFAISLLLFSNLFIGVTSYEEIPSRRILSSYFDGEVNDCIVFPGGQSLIPELSNPEANGLERLVVYLYRNIKTNQVHVFKPSPQKQALIPNIPFTQGDSLTDVTTETIVSLFNNHYNFVSPQNPDTTQGEPIGLNIGIVDNKGDNSRPNGGSAEYPNDEYFNELSNRDKPDLSEFPHLYWYPSQQPIESQSNPDPQQFFNPQQFQPSDQLQTNTANLTDIYLEKDIWESNKEKYITPLNPYQNNPSVPPVEPNNDKPPVYNVYNPEGNSPQKFSTFDMWFKNQMKTLQNPTLFQGVRTIDTNALKSLVLETLSDNHINIGAKGMTIDDSGIPIDLRNLELRPVLIGSSVNFNALEGHKQLILPQALPYLEGILIILNYPLKILGVIPLGKIYVSLGGKATEPLQSRRQEVNNQSKLDGAWSNLKSLFRLPFHAGRQTRKAIQTKLQQPELSISMALNQDPLAYLYNEPITSKLSSFYPPHDTSIRWSDNNNWNSPSDVHWDYKTLQNNIPNLLTNPEANSRSAVPYSSTDNPIKNTWRPASSTWKQLLGSNVSPQLSNSPHLTVTPLDGKVASRLNSKSYSPNVLKFGVNPVNSDVNPASTYYISSKNIPNFAGVDSKSRQEYYPGYNNNDLAVATDSKDTVDSSYWNSLQNSGWENYNKLEKPQTNQQSTWASAWGGSTRKFAPSPSNGNNLDDNQSQTLAAGDVSVQNDKSIGSTRRFTTPLFHGFIRTLLEMVLQHYISGMPLTSARRKIDDTNTTDIKVNRTLVNPKGKSRQVDSDDSPDFRIIGGSAATGSGAPLSNKGRSGLSIN